MSKSTITKEIEIYHCDICGEETTNIIKCSICKKDICSKSSCRAWNQCKECWDKDETYASIESKSETDTGYEGRTHTTLIIKHKSPNKWHELLSRFYGKKVKITIEEVISDEEKKDIKRKKEEEQFLKGDDITKFIERCG